MLKLKRFFIDKIDPSVTQKGQIEFLYHDCYLCKSQIGGISILTNDTLLSDNWAQKEIKKYCTENNLQLCTIHTVSHMPDYSNIVVDDVIKALIEQY